MAGEVSVRSGGAGSLVCDTERDLTTGNIWLLLTWLRQKRLCLGPSAVCFLAYVYLIFIRFLQGGMFLKFLEMVQSLSKEDVCGGEPSMNPSLF